MSTSRLPAPDVPLQAAPLDESSVHDKLVTKLNLISDCRLRMLSALEEDDLRESTVHYVLDQIGRVRDHVKAMSEMLINFERNRDTITLDVPAELVHQVVRSGPGEPFEDAPKGGA